MGQLTTHVLDTAQGKPGAAIRIRLYRLDGETVTLLATTVTNDDGRTDAPMLSGEKFAPGCYQLVFDTAAYFTGQGIPLAEVPFLDDVVIRFGISDGEAHYHVPLLLSPYGYSTYRGS